MASATSSPTPHEPVVVVGRRALVTTVVAVALNPVSLFFGYFINHWLQSPKLEAKYANAVASVNNRRIGSRGMALLKRDRKMAATLREIMMTSSLAPNGPQNVCTRWLDGEDWNDDCELVAKDGFRGLKQEIQIEADALNKNIAILQDWKPGKPLILEPIDSPDAELTRTMQMVQGGRFDASQAAANLKYVAQRDETILKDLDKLYKEFDAMLNSTPPRTGVLWVYVGVLNSGDSDGVVFDSGTAKIKDLDVPLHSEDNEYKVVKAHSFEQTSFWLDFSKLSESQRKSITDEIIQGKTALPVSLLVNTGQHSISGSTTLQSE